MSDSNGKRRAVGLHYEGGQPGETGAESAPTVCAAGTGEIAERILAVAEAHGVPVRSDPDLLELLALTNVGEEIPVEVYGAVATLLTFLYRLNSELGGDATSA